MDQENTQVNNPLHGIKLADILDFLVKTYGWETLGSKIKINCFNSDPSVKSSLKFLRRTEWARKEVEELYLRSQKTVSPPKVSKSNKATKFGRRE